MSVEGQALLLQIEAIINRVSSSDNIQPNTPSDSSALQNSIQYVFDRPDIDINNPVQILGTIILKINSGNINEDVEKKIREILTSQEFREKVLNIKGSNSIKEDLEEAFKQKLDPKVKKVTLPKHTKKAAEIKKVKPTSLRGLNGKFYSIANLQIILNQRLHDVIKRNMGKGNARSILNYRTGRFARSAEIKKLTLDKQGVVNTFYTYMKYPYQTFEPGYKQGKPSSRDPKRLIDKSIRQIAKEIVTNRMKAILV